VDPSPFYGGRQSSGTWTGQLVVKFVALTGL